MQRKKPDVDVIMDILEALLEARPDSTFVKSLHFQYQERDGLSKKQLEGLLSKAQKVSSIPDHKLATLEAEIRKRPNRYKSAAPTAKAEVEEKEDKVTPAIEQILAKYPQHKRVLFFQSKVKNNDALNPTELSELEKFQKLLLK